MSKTSITPTTVVNVAALPPLLSVKQAAQLGVGGERYVRMACETGAFKAVKVGRTWRINTAALLKQFGLTDLTEFEITD